MNSAVLGYQAITANGLPIGNIVPTIEEAEEVLTFDPGYILEVIIPGQGQPPYMRRVRTNFGTAKQV